MVIHVEMGSVSVEIVKVWILKFDKRRSHYLFTFRLLFSIIVVVGMVESRKPFRPHRRLWKDPLLLKPESVVRVGRRNQPWKERDTIHYHHRIKVRWAYELKSNLLTFFFFFIMRIYWQFFFFFFLRMYWQILSSLCIKIVLKVSYSFKNVKSIPNLIK